MEQKRITAPLDRKEVKQLQVGDSVLISGTIYVARDAAHQRMESALRAGERLPIPIEGVTIYYMGPSPARPDRVIGAAGPTTAGRMDRYTPSMLDQGMVAMIGKGKRSTEVKEAMVRNGAVYFAAIGGAGALLSQAIIQAEVVAYADLGPEAILKLKVKDFPVTVVFDVRGNDLYEMMSGGAICG